MFSQPSPRVPKYAPLCVALIASCCVAQAQIDVVTWHNDSSRTGQNLSETILTPSQVNASNFGLLKNVPVDGKVDAQPLYVSALNIPNQGTHNVLFVASEHDSVYAVDADNGQVLWQKSMLASGETTSDARNCDQVTPEIGITATPAIDRQTGAHGTIYLVAMSKDASGNYHHRVHALDLTTGAEQPNSPTEVHATYPGSEDGSSNGTVVFDPKQYKERPGLLLLNGQLYTSWSSHCDIRPYGGWMMTYDKNSLQQTSAFDFVPNGSDAAPWNAGAGPAADAAGNVYISLGNGTFDTSLNLQGFPNQGDFGNAMVKLALQNSKLHAIDYWTMYNSNDESNSDTDLGSGGLMLLPDQLDATGRVRHLAVAAGKDSNLYVADRDNMGHFNASSNANLYQELGGALPGGIWSSPAYFNGHVYYGSVGSNLRSFGISGGRLVNAPQTSSNGFGYPGTTPSISAYNQSNGIVWAPENGSLAVLHAYDAGDLTKELYNSNQAANSRDHFGTGNKFVTPTIANGKVYLGTTNSVGIFGFVAQSAVPLADGDYVLTNGTSHLVIDDPGASTSAGTAMYQWTPNGGDNQKWFVSSNGRGFYTIQNVSSHLFLTNANGAATPGLALQQSTPVYDASELWSITPSAGGFVIKNKATGLVIDDSGLSMQTGPHIILWNANGGVNQTWSFK